MLLFYEVFKECRKLVCSDEFQNSVGEWFCRPPLKRFGNVSDMLGFLNDCSNRTSLGEVRRRNRILKELLRKRRKRGRGVSLDPLFLVLFQRTLQKIFKQYRSAHPEADEVGQVIFTVFLDVVSSYSIKKRPQKIALNITLDTRQKVSEWVLRQNKIHQTEINREKELPDTNEECSYHPEEALVTLMDLASGFGYDERSDQLCIRINQLHEKGIISDTEKRLLVERLIYKKTLKKMVKKNEYERRKKQIQRLTQKIMRYTTN